MIITLSDRKGAIKLLGAALASDHIIPPIELSGM
jgi:hypothetical protein